ncbi:1-acylglycerol-3-phosphate O-acyltransferase [Ranunculus cassubicifolius]
MGALSCPVPSTLFPCASPKSRIFRASCIQCQSLNVVPRITIGSPRVQFGQLKDGFYKKLEFCTPSDEINSQIRCRKPRNIVVKSQVADAGSPDASYSSTEFELGSKVRGICFYSVTALTAIFLFVMMILVHPFVLLFDRYRRKAHHLIAKIWATITIFPFIKIEFEGLENLPSRDIPAVYVSNHQSFLDIYTILILGRSVKFISKVGIFVFPIVGWAMYLLGTVPLKRKDSRSQLECFKRCMDILRKGASVFFFPEGTRSADGKLMAFKKGAFSLATKTGVPVVPITLVGTGQIMPRGMETTLHPGSVKVVIHKPIQGTDPDLLCAQSRNVIESALLPYT